jgi:hypothetical protein
MSPEFSLKEPYTIRTLQCGGNPQHNWMCWKEEGKKVIPKTLEYGWNMDFRVIPRVHNCTAHRDKP